LSSLAKQRPASSHRRRHNLSPRRPHNKGPLFDTLHSTHATTQPIRAVSYSPLLPFFFLPDARTVPWLRFRLRIFLPCPRIHAFTSSCNTPWVLQTESRNRVDSRSVSSLKRYCPPAFVCVLLVVVVLFPVLCCAALAHANC
jgi:hypothetical protein